MENKEPILQKDKITAIFESLENIGFTILDIKTDVEMKSLDVLPTGIIDLKIIPSRLFL